MSLLRRLFATPTASDFPDAAEALRCDADAHARAGSPADTAERQDVIAKAATLDVAGRYGESLALVDRALRTTPADPELLYAKGCTLFAWGRTQEALDAFLRAEDDGLCSPELYLHLGWACLGTAVGNAEEWMRKAATAEPTSWRAHFGLAKVLQADRRNREAISSYERTLELHQDEIESLINLGVCRLELADAAAGEAQFRRAIAVASERADAWNFLGIALEYQGRYGEAREAFERATRIEAHGESADSCVNLAFNLLNSGQTQEALELFECNLAQRVSIDAHGNYAQALRTAGRLPDGWTHFEFRWLKEPLLSYRPSIRQPVWAGQDLRGKTILLRAEQGLGDTLQFIRYAPHVRALGATVVLEVQSELVDLAGEFPGVDRIVGPGQAPPDIDFYIHLLSLPRIFGTDLASIPAAIPYLSADPELRARWAPHLVGDDGALRVGMVWGGNPGHSRDRYRSIALDRMASLGEVPGLRWFALQKDSREDEAKAPPAGFDWVNLGPKLTHFGDTAAVISQLDLVISVDTAAAHLAGALGKPVWLLVPTPAEWRWLEEREDSPWYPTMRLFRQRQRGDWAEVIERVKEALRARVQGCADETTSDTNPIVQATMKSVPLVPVTVLPSAAPGHRPGFSAVAETRHGILQYLPDAADMGASLGWYGEWLELQLELLGSLLRPGATVLEAGAGVGAHAVFLATAIGSVGHLFLYEPRGVMQQILRQNLAANRVGNVTLMRRALGAAGVPLEVETVDELQLERLDWLKLNDGATALAVLDGAAETLWRLRPMLFIAAPNEPMLRELSERAQAYGYRCWRVATALFNPKNFNRRDDDIFGGRMALALLAIPEELEIDVAFDGCVELT